MMLAQSVLTKNAARARMYKSVTGKQLSGHPSLSRGQIDAKSRAQMCARIDRAHSFRFAVQY
jgi:hypothetical protein